MKKNVFQSGKKNTELVFLQEHLEVKQLVRFLEEEADAGFPTSTESRGLGFGVGPAEGLTSQENILFGNLVLVSLSVSGKTSGFQVEIAPPLLIIISLLTKQ